MEQVIGGRLRVGAAVHGYLPRLSAEHPPERSPDPPKHIRDRLRRPLSAPRRPNAATVQRRGDLPKRLRPGGLGLANGRRNAVGEGVGASGMIYVGDRVGSRMAQRKGQTAVQKSETPNVSSNEYPVPRTVRIGSPFARHVGKCLAETPDIADIDGATLDFSHITPNAVEYLRARKHAAGPFEEKLQQAEFYRREMDLA